MHERIKEHDRDIRLSRTPASAVTEHAASKTGHYPLWGEVQFIDQDPHWYSRRGKEATNNFNRDSGIEIPEAWMPAIRQHNSRSLPQRTAEGSVSSCDNTNNALDRNPPTMSEFRETPITTTVVQIVQLSKSTLLPDGDLQCAVERTRSISK